MSEYGALKVEQEVEQVQSFKKTVVLAFAGLFVVGAVVGLSAVSSNATSSAVNANRNKGQLAAVPGVMEKTQEVLNMTSGDDLRYAIFSFTPCCENDCGECKIVPTVQGQRSADWAADWKSFNNALPEDSVAAAVYNFEYFTGESSTANKPILITWAPPQTSDKQLARAGYYLGSVILATDGVSEHYPLQEMGEGYMDFCTDVLQIDSDMCAKEGDFHNCPFENDAGLAPEGTPCEAPQCDGAAFTNPDLSADEGTIPDECCAYIKLVFAIPKKGRMHEKCLKFLEAAGLEYERPDRVDVAICTNMPIKIVFLPASDIATFVGEGNVDLGITGEDIIAETGMMVNVSLKLGFGKCKLALQVPIEHAKQPLAAYVGSRIVTSFPNITSKFFKPLDEAATAAAGKVSPAVQTRIKELGGSVEAACGLGLADAVVDLVETGTTMKAAGLCMLETLMQTEAVLIDNPQSKHPELVKKIVSRITGYIDSTKYQLLNYNVSRSNLAAAVKITPGKKSPSILPLERGDWVAVSVMVMRKGLAEIIDQIVAVGATDVLVFSLANCRV